MSHPSRMGAHALYLVRFLDCPEIQASLQSSCTGFPCLPSARVPGVPRQTGFPSVCIAPGALLISPAGSLLYPGDLEQAELYTPGLKCAFLLYLVLLLNTPSLF